MNSFIPFHTAIILLQVVTVILAYRSSSDTSLSPYEVLFSWRSLDFQFPSPQVKRKYIQTGQFIPENNVLAGIKIHGNRAYLTVPRLRTGVPSTLNYINLNSLNLDKSPPLIPYPSWKMQRVGNCNALQFVISMDIDRWGRMWVIDAGREAILDQAASNSTTSSTSCPAKLVIINLATNTILHKHEFPAWVVNPRTNFINDIVLDCQSDQWGCWAYMTDSWDAKLVVYSLSEDRSWPLKHSASMNPDPKATQLTILGTTYTFNSGINGIALSPRRTSNHDRLYYCPLTSFSIYSVPTSAIKQAFREGQTNLSDADVASMVKHRSTQSGGIMMDSTGLLFTGQYQHNAVSYFNTTNIIATSGNHLFKKETLVIANDEDLQWPDTFAIDSHGYLYVVTNRMHRFFASTMDFDDVNFRVVRVFVGSQSYMY